MKTVIYLDVLLLTNFLIAYGLLSAAGLLAGLRGRFGRMAAASAAAALTALAILWPEQPYWMQLLYKLGTGAAVAAIAFGVRRPRRFLAAACWYTALNLLLAGLCILAILRTGSPLLQTGNLAVYLRLSPLLLVGLAGACSLAVWLGLRLFGAPERPGKTAGLEVTLCGTPVRLRAALDTGCHLKDPITCLPVLLISYPAARSRLPHELCTFLDAWYEGGRADPPPGFSLRLIPCATAAGHTVLPGAAVPGIGLISPGGVLSRGSGAVAFTRQPFDGDYEALYGNDFF